MVTNENDDVDAARTEISQTMVDEIVTGIRDYCSARPNPLLSPERHFFREVGCGLHAMKYDDLLTLCAAAITRIAFEDNK